MSFAAGIAFKVLDDRVETASGHVSIGTMHLAKGMEFRAVAGSHSSRKARREDRRLSGRAL